MTRRYVDALVRFEEREVFFHGLCHITGFDQRPCTARKHNTSKSTYTLRRKAALAVDTITSFTNAPLVAIFYFGALISFLASVWIAFLVCRRMFFAHPLLGWTSTMASIWLIGGLIILFIGAVGVYLSKVFAETKRRPYAIIRQIYEKTQGTNPG
jgi:putative glycosyltransferase